MEERLSKGLMLAVAVFTLYCTKTKPRWYWEHSKSLFWRNLFGDRGAETFYSCLGILLLSLWIAMVTR